MKIRKHSFIALASSLLQFGSAFAAEAAKTYDFNDPGQWTELRHTGTGIWSNPSSGGLNDTPWAAIAAPNNSIPGFHVAPETVSTTQESLTLAVSFLWKTYDPPAPAQNNAVMLGIGKAATETATYIPIANGSGVIEGDATGHQLQIGIGTLDNGQIRLRGGGVRDKERFYFGNNSQAPTATLTDNQWYYMEVTITRGIINTTFDITLSLYEQSPTGTIGSLVLTGSYNQSVPGLLDTDVYAFVGGVSQRYSNVAGIDNFTIPVPEPNSLSLLLGGAALAGFCRLRLTRKSTTAPTAPNLPMNLAPSRLGMVALCALLHTPLPLQANPQAVHDRPGIVLNAAADKAELTFQQQAGQFRMTNGKTDLPVTLKLLEEKKLGNHRTLRYTISEIPSARLELTLEAQQEGYFALDVKVVQEGDEQLWLEPSLHFTMPTGPFKWFDGFAEHSKANARDAYVGTLPLAAYYSEGKGWAVGLDPHHYVSHFRSKVTGTEGEGNGFEYASRMVVDPKGSETRRFVLFGFEPDFGYRNAVAAYQRFFADRFSMTQGVNPNLAGPTSGTLSWRMKNAYYPHAEKSHFMPQFNDLFRMMGNTWTWCYAGFGFRPGDWLCTEELTGDWMVPLNKEQPDKKSPARVFLKRSATEHLQLHLAAYNRLKDAGQAPLMYIIPTYCEEELAREKFADSIYYDKNGKTRSSGPPWVVRFDRSLTMYPYGNSFGEYTLNAIRTIVERSNISGFAFDCIDRGGYLYTGPGTEKSPGRAYDRELGVYVNCETANILFGDAVHALKRGNEVMALAGNFRGSSGGYLSAMAMDAAILEHSPWDDRPLPATARLLMGRKSITYQHGYARLPEVKRLDKDKIVSMVQTLADYTVLKALNYGIYPSIHSVIGSPQMAYYYPVFNDLFRHYGWEPVPAARTQEEKLWLARYGSAEGGVIFVGNSTPRKIGTPLEISSKYFSGGSTAFVDYEGLFPVANRISGEKTAIDLKLKRGTGQLFAAALHWKTPVNLEVTGTRIRSVGEAVVDRLEFNLEKAEKVALSALQLPEHLVAEITVGGKTVPFERKNGLVTFEAPLVKGKNEVVIRQTPLVGLSTPKEALSKLELLTSEGKPAFGIRLQQETPELRRVAERFGPFFTPIESGATVPAVNITADANQPSGDLTITLGIQETAPNHAEGEIALEGNTLRITGRDLEALNKAVSLLFQILKERYPNYGYLTISDGPIQTYANTLKPGLFQEKTGTPYLFWNRKP